MLSYIARIKSRCRIAQRQYGTEWTVLYSAAKRCASAHPRTGNSMLECSGKRWKSTARASGSGHRQASYWSQFPDFRHNENVPIKKEFKRLAKLKGWIGNDPRKEETETQKNEKKEMRRREWGECIRSEFGKHYGDDALSLAGWQSLCREVGLAHIPQSVEECRKALKGKKWVNIVDLVDRRRTGRKVDCHETEEALRSYTRRTKKIFPLEAAKENGFLTALLIEIFL